MRNIILYVVVVAVSSGLAWGLFQKFRADEAVPDPDLESIENPLWYRELPFEERKAALQKRLDLMASTAVAAHEAGPMKDDVALLCRDPLLVDWVVEQFRARKDLSSAQLSAYMEIFARVANEKFAPLLAQGVRSRRFEPKVNALDAAVTQKEPKLINDLAVALRTTDDSYPARRVIDALCAIGGNEALHEVEKAIASNERDVVIHAIRAAVGFHLRSAAPLIEPRLDDPDAEIALCAAWGMASLGVSRARRRIEDMVRDRRLPEGVRAQAIQFLHPWTEDSTGRVLREVMDDPASAVNFEARIALATLRDAPVLFSLAADLESSSLAARVNAATILGCTGAEEDVALIRSKRAMLNDATLSAFIKGMARGGSPAAAGLLLELAREEGDIAVDAIAAFHAIGDAGFEALRELLADEPKGERLGHVIAALASFKTPEALALLETIRPGKDRRIWLYHRNNIRQLELELLRQGILSQ